MYLYISDKAEYDYHKSLYLKELGKNIAYYRKQKNISQTGLGELVSSNQPTVSAWESGRLKPGMKKVKLIAKVLKIKPDLILQTNIPSTIKINDSLEIDSELAIAAFTALYNERKMAMGDANELLSDDSKLSIQDFDLDLVKEILVKLGSKPK